MELLVPDFSLAKHRLSLESEQADGKPLSLSLSLSISTKLTLSIYEALSFK